MAANSDRHVDQILLALKKGTQLIKYSRKGKPKLCPFRVSSDETTLIWFSHKRERTVNLASVIRIIPGQRTAVFRRFLRPEKDYLSFSLIYKNGERSLDLVCKDQFETEIWFSGLKSLISTGNQRPSRINDQVDYEFFDAGCGSLRNSHTEDTAVGITSTSAQNTIIPLFGSNQVPSSKFVRSDAGSDSAIMQLRSSNVDAARLSISSAPSSSSQGSGPDDIESLGDVYVWGELWCDGPFDDGSTNSLCSKVDVLLPKSLESNVVLDVQQIACGFRHAALITRQGEVFTWGEESCGQLGHGSNTNISQPRLVELLATWSIDYVACGEHHTCAISSSGDLFTWGNGTYNTGLLGHGTSISYWTPKRVSGPLEGLQVFSVSCGTWHSALVTSNGKVYTFGDGTFGVLGHGDRESFAYPKEVEALSGLRTVKVACGVWHTAAIVEVMGQTGINFISRKLFTWGDGDKYRLGHGDKEPRLVPTCVSSLIDYNFHQLACGHSITVALATSGHVFTMGSTIHGQLGNPQSDGKIPCLVQDRLVGELVEEIACGTYHVAVLTSRSEVYTWGRCANGQLGHGDMEDMKTPVFVEALRDRHVKSISCGSNFTACICIHKWVSGAEQSFCTGCRQAFGFTRKRHNCYNCGLVHCHACSSKKLLKAALAPTPGKPHRVCDSCYSKLKAAEVGSPSINRRNIIPRHSIDTTQRSEREESRSSKVLLSRIGEPRRYETTRGSFSPTLASQVTSLLPIKDIYLPSSFSSLQTRLKPIVTSSPSSLVNSRPSSPYSTKLSPTHSVASVFSNSVVDSLKKTNELLNQEVLKLQAQVKTYKQRCEIQDVLLQKAESKAEQTACDAAEKSAKCKTAIELIKSLYAKLMDAVERFPPENGINLKDMYDQVESFLKSNESITSASISTSVESKNNARDDSHRNEGGADEGSTTQASISDASYAREGISHQSIEEGSKELLEHFEPGVYATVVQLPNGTKVFKRIRFSKRRFAEQQAEDWWSKNKDRVYKKYSHACPSVGPGPGPGPDPGPAHYPRCSSTASSSSALPTEEKDVYQL